jgi:RNA polymerase subunit RPABC4/transcription elongation factor Spt4
MAKLKVIKLYKKHASFVRIKKVFVSFKIWVYNIMIIFLMAINLRCSTFRLLCTCLNCKKFFENDQHIFFGCYKIELVGTWSGIVGIYRGWVENSRCFYFIFFNFSNLWRNFCIFLWLCGVYKSVEMANSRTTLKYILVWLLGVLETLLKWRW